MIRKFVLTAAVLSSILVADLIADYSGIETAITCVAATYDRNSDGYIYKGTVTLTRVKSGRKETFYLFNRRGVAYVATSKSGPYYKLERRMTINRIEYKY